MSGFLLTGVLLACAGSAVATLPDNRAYELVSPIEKGGLSFNANLAVADASGDHVIVDGGSGNALLSNGFSWMSETRTPAGWSGAQVGPSPTAGADFHEQAEVSLNSVSEDFSRFAFTTRMPLDPRASTHGMSAYVRSGPTGPFRWASGPPAPAIPVSEPGECLGGLEPVLCVTNRAVFAGASSDLEDVVWGQYHPLVASPASLPGSPVDTHEHGYEVYESVGGVDELTGLVPAGSERECGPTHGSCGVPPCGAAMGNDTGTPAFFFGFAPVAGAVSGDGSEVVFTSPDPVSYHEAIGCAAPEVYVREDGTTTVQVSASQKAGGDPSGPQEKVYTGSSEEGGHLNTVFFVSKEELTKDANTGGSDEGDDLYAYSLATKTLTDLTPENNTPGPPSKREEEEGKTEGKVEVAFIGSSANGTVVYFTASSALATGASAGHSNLYVYDASTGRTRFIAPGTGLKSSHTGLLYSIFPEEARLTSEVTPDGQHMVFVSSERLTEYNNFGPECNGRASEGLPVREPGPCAEVYLYAAASDDLVCVSCNPSGAPPAGSARLPERFKEGYLDGRAEPGTLPAPRAINDNGSRVFFSSPDRLTVEAPPPVTTRGPQAPIAINWEYEPNVYEYENKNVHLIAPAAVLLTTTPSGNDVFFDTYGQVTPQDTDGSPDVYDARVGGGFPVLAPPACSGSACQGTPAAPTIFATPPSATFTGVGNLSPIPQKPVATEKPKHCRNGFVLRKKKCVKKRRVKKAVHGKTKVKATHGKGRL